MMPTTKLRMLVAKLLVPIMVSGVCSRGAGAPAASAVAGPTAMALSGFVEDLASRACTISRFSEVPGGVHVISVSIGTAVGYMTCTLVGSTTFTDVTT